MSDKNKDIPSDFLEEPELTEDKPILSAAEIEAIKKEAKTSILAERKAVAKKDLLEREKHRLKVEEGLVTGDGVRDEMVTITIDVASFSPYILINQRPYWHGHTYTVPRHLADTMRDMMYRTWGHQNEIDGKSRSDFYAAKRVADLFKPSVRGSRSISAKDAG